MIEPIEQLQKLSPEDLLKIDQVCQQIMGEYKTLAEINNISSEELEEIYRRGLEDYQQSHLEQAMASFGYLVLHQPWDRRFHLAFASTLHWAGDYQRALTFYSYALAMDACDPASSFRMAQCLVSLGDENSAIEALQLAIKQSYSKPEYRETGELAQSLLDQLNGVTKEI